MRHVLKTPVEFNGTTVQNITLRRAKAKDMVRIADHLPALQEAAKAEVSGMTGATVAAMIELVSALGDVPRELVEEISFSDLIAATSTAADFLFDPESDGSA